MSNLRIKITGLIIMLIPQLGRACAVCFGDPNSSMNLGVNAAIITLGGFTGTVFGGLIFLMLKIRKNIRLAENQDKLDKFKLSNQKFKEGHTL